MNSQNTCSKKCMSEGWFIMGDFSRWPEVERDQLHSSRYIACAGWLFERLCKKSEVKNFRGISDHDWKFSSRHCLRKWTASDFVQSSRIQIWTRLTSTWLTWLSNLRPLPSPQDSEWLPFSQWWWHRLCCEWLFENSRHGLLPKGTCMPHNYWTKCVNVGGDYAGKYICPVF